MIGEFRNILCLLLIYDVVNLLKNYNGIHVRRSLQAKIVDIISIKRLNINQYRVPNVYGIPIIPLVAFRPWLGEFSKLSMLLPFF